MTAFWFGLTAMVLLVSFLIFLPLIRATKGAESSQAAPSTPVSKRVKWMIGGVIGILILALIWQALPTVSTPEQVASVSWFYNLMSYLDVSNTTFGKPVAELVGVTLAPFVLAIAAVALAVAVFYLVHWGGPRTTRAPTFCERRKLEPHKRSGKFYFPGLYFFI